MKNSVSSGGMEELAKMNKELEEGYVAWAETNRRDAEFFLPAQAEVVPADEAGVCRDGIRLDLPESE
ncbi:MAG: hypothetical protein AB1374_06065 [Bacillota bacterium]